VENCRGPFYEWLDALSGSLAGHNAIPDFRHRANFKIPVDLVCDLLDRVIAARRSGAKFSERHPLSGRSGLTANKVVVTVASLDMQLAPLDAAWSSGPASDDLVRS
jgi:hypothetical protein